MCLCVHCRSEHERHVLQCPYIRGESTDNVPVSLTDATHPALHVVAGEQDTDRVVCLGTSLGSQLVAVGTEWGHIVLLDLSCRLTILVRRFGVECLVVGKVLATALDTWCGFAWYPMAYHIWLVLVCYWEIMW